MHGYGFSVWLLPQQRAKLLKLLAEKMNIRISHIPHITVRTNFERKVEAQEFAKTLSGPYSFEVRGALHLSSKQYEVDPLDAWVFPALVPELEIPDAHLSTAYMKNGTNPTGHIIHFVDKGDVVVANTESENPREWHLCYF